MTPSAYTDAELVNLAVRASKKWPIPTSDVVPRLVAELRQARAELAALTGKKGEGQCA